MAANEVALRKRQQIAGANKAMFLWVAGASVVVGAALVVSLFLINKLTFTERVLQKKQTTASTLDANLSEIDKLKDQVRVLNTNSSLKSVMNPDETDPVQVVLDALPATANSAALGASLQQKLLVQDGIVIDSVAVNPPAGELAATDTGDATATDAQIGSATTQNFITFTFTVHTDGNNPEAISNLLKKLEKSVRTIDLDNIALTYQDNIQLTVSGKAYYQPAKTTKLGSETVKP